jgi:putative cell wall-binding protein
MKKVPQILFIALLGLITPAAAQVVMDSDSIIFHSEKWIDSIKVEYNKYKEHLISTDLIKPNWLKVRIGFNYQCDTFLFQDNYYDLQNFNQKFKDFIISKSNLDTVVLQIDFGDNLNIGLLFRSFGILTSSIDKHKGHGTYYFKAYEPPREKEKNVKTDTIDLYVDKVIKYNGAIVKKVDLSSLLQMNKPEIVILRADNELPIQDLVDILQIGNDLKIKMILGKK